MRSRAPSDDELLRMLREHEDAARHHEEAEDQLELQLRDQEAIDAGDPCPACGNPTENLGECHVCTEEGCLPPELWTPGQADNCLTLCTRCARTIHLTCAREDGAGNPTCPTCKF